MCTNPAFTKSVALDGESNICFMLDVPDTTGSFVINQSFRYSGVPYTIETITLSTSSLAIVERRGTSDVKVDNTAVLVLRDGSEVDAGG